MKTRNVVSSCLLMFLVLCCRGQDGIDNVKAKSGSKKDGSDRITQSTVTPSKKSLSTLTNKRNLSFGVYIYRKTLERYRGREKELVSNCRQMGITEVYLSFSNRSFEGNSKEYSDYLSKTLSLFHQEKIDVSALSFDDPLLLFRKERVKEIIRNIDTFNEKASGPERFDGIAADLEPHMLKSKNPRYRGKSTVYWDRNNYGKNGGNDQLLEKTLKVIKKMRSLTRLSLCQSVVYSYYSHYSKGELIHGKPGDFLSAGCNYILLMIYRDKVDKVIEKAEPFLKQVARKNSVMVTVKTSVNTAGGEGAKTTFADRSWGEFYNDLKLLVGKTNNYSSMRGVAFFEYEGLEEIWQK